MPPGRRWRTTQRMSPFTAVQQNKPPVSYIITASLNSLPCSPHSAPSFVPPRTPCSDKSGGGQVNSGGRGRWRRRRRRRPSRDPPRARSSSGDSFPDQDFQRRSQVPPVLSRSAATTTPGGGGGGCGGSAAQHQHYSGVCAHRRSMLSHTVGAGNSTSHVPWPAKNYRDVHGSCPHRCVLSGRGRVS